MSSMMYSPLLPQEVVEKIVWCTRTICRNDEFFYDLRLVNHQFNEAVIYNLFLRDGAHPPASRQYHRACTACSMSQTSFGRFNTSYARMRLQAQLNQRTKSDCSASREWHASLKVAISVLTNTLAELHLYSARHRIEADRRFASSSSHPVLADRISLMLCDAVANALDITHKGRLRDWHQHSLKVHHYSSFHLAPPSFWIIITIYHIGDLDLIKRFLLDESFMELITESRFGSLSMCLSIAARHGHSHVLLYVMNNYMENVPYNKSRILDEACIAGQTECARLLRFAFLEADREKVVTESVGKLANTELQPALDYQVCSLLVDQCRSVLSSDMSMILLCQRKGQFSSLTKLLQERDWDRWKAPMLPSLTKAGHRRPKFWYLRVENLIYSWRHLPASKAEFEDLCKMTAEVAIEMNRIDLMEALYEHIEGDIASMGVSSVIEAGGTDGGICLLEARDLSEPRIWHKSISYYHENVEIGQATLRNALRNLQVDNVSFLLERQIRLPERMIPVQVDWRYRRTRHRQYEAVQRLLQEYSMKPVEVVLQDSTRSGYYNQTRVWK